MTLTEALSAFHAHCTERDREASARVAGTILSTWPDAWVALDLVGAALFELGEVPLALACVDQACRAAHAGAAQHTRRAVLYRRVGNLSEALASAQRAAAIAPESAPLQAQVAQLLTAGGAFEEAAAAYAAAVAIDPALAPARAGAALVLLTLGRAGDALEHAQAAVELDGGKPGSASLLAMIEGVLHGPDRAIARLGEVVAAHPDDVTAHVAYARSLLKAERPIAALAAAERAAALAPTEPVALEMLAVCQQVVGRHTDALATLERAEALAPAAATLLAKKGVVLAELGRTTEAAEAFSRALALEPDSAPAWYGRVDLPEVVPSAADVDAMERALATSPRLRAYDDRLAMEFAAARTALRYGDDERAFAHFAVGNRMKRELLDYDVANDERIMRSIAESVTPEFLERAAHGERSEVPVFVVGMPRSGTTLVEQILGAHPSVYAAGELPHIPAVIAALLQSPERSDLAVAGRAYLAAVRPLAPDALRIVDKLPANFLRAGVIRAMLPDARVVHVRRSALDTCLSCYTTLFEGRQDFSYDLTELGRFYRAYETLMEHWRAVLPPEHFFEIEYERVVDDLDGSARALIAFLGLPWDAATLRFNASARPIRTASKTQVRQPIFRSSIGRGERLRAHLGPLVDVLGR
ncbi:MAG: sulfotransferase [Vulcanimicrobiaceae bacterium]